METPERRFLDANPAYCMITGYSIDELRNVAFPQLILFMPMILAENMQQYRPDACRRDHKFRSRKPLLPQK